MKVRLPLWGKSQGFATVDTEATPGATLGVNVFRADGSLVTEADLNPPSAETPVVARTLWDIIADIPSIVSALAALATDGILRKSGVTLSAHTLSEILDFIGSATSGDILYRGASTWARLPKGSDTQVLTLASGLPSWAAAGGGGGGAGAQVGYARTVSTTTASTTDTSIPTDNTIPQITEGVAYTALDTTYTPTDAASLLEIEAIIPFSASTVSSPKFALFRDSGANAIAATIVSITAAGGFLSCATLRTVIAAGSTAATTFKLRYSGQSGTLQILQAGGINYMGAANVATMTVREIKQ